MKTFLVVVTTVFFFSLQGCSDNPVDSFPNPDQQITFVMNETVNLGTVNGYSYNATLTGIERVIETLETEMNLTFRTDAGEFTFNVNQYRIIDLLFDNNHLLTLEITGIYDQVRVTAYVYYNPYEM